VSEKGVHILYTCDKFSKKIAVNVIIGLCNSQLRTRTCKHTPMC